MAPVRNLVVKENNDGVHAVWEQPMFVQNLTNIKYGITVTGGGLAIFTANNIEDLQFTVSIDMLSLCLVYIFNVVAYEDSLQSNSISASFVFTGGRKKVNFIVDLHISCFPFKRCQYLYSGSSHDV